MIIARTIKPESVDEKVEKVLTSATIASVTEESNHSPSIEHHEKEHLRTFEQMFRMVEKAERR